MKKSITSKPFIVDEYHLYPLDKNTTALPQTSTTVEASTILTALKNPTQIEDLPKRSALAWVDFKIDEHLLKGVSHDILLKVLKDELYNIEKSLLQKEPNRTFDPDEVYFDGKRLIFYKNQ